jgi:hypothetical protein
MLTRACELGGLKSWIVAHGDYDERASDLLNAIDAHLTAVRTTAADTGNGRTQEAVARCDRRVVRAHARQPLMPPRFICSASRPPAH